jgi:hypothetical protein
MQSFPVGATPPATSSPVAGWQLRWGAPGQTARERASTCRKRSQHDTKAGSKTRMARHHPTRTGSGSTVRVWPRRWGAPGSTFPTTQHTSQGCNGSKAGSQDGAAWRTALDATGWHQGQSPPTCGRSGSPAWNRFLALGCAWSQPTRSHSLHKVAMARRPSTERKPRRAHCAWHDARRGVIPGSAGKRSAHCPVVRSTRCCGLGWPRCWVHTGAACRDGRPWGTATRRTLCTVARRHAHSHGVKGLSGAREGGKPRFSQWGEGVVVAGLTKKAALCRGSRRCPAPRSVPGHAFSSRCGRPLPAWCLVRHLLATVGLQRRCAGNGGRTTPSFPPPLPFPLAAALTGMGKTPKRVGGVRQRPRGSSYRVTVKAVQG